MVKALPYVAVIQKFVSIPLYFIYVFAAGCCVSALYLIKHENVWGFIGLMLLFNVLAFVGSYGLYKTIPTPRGKEKESESAIMYGMGGTEIKGNPLQELLENYAKSRGRKGEI